MLTLLAALAAGNIGNTIILQNVVFEPEATYRREMTLRPASGSPAGVNGTPPNMIEGRIIVPFLDDPNELPRLSISLTGSGITRQGKPAAPPTIHVELFDPKMNLAGAANLRSGQGSHLFNPPNRGSSHLLADQTKPPDRSWTTFLVRFSLPEESPIGFKGSVSLTTKSPFHLLLSKGGTAQNPQGAFPAAVVFRGFSAGTILAGQCLAMPMFPKTGGHVHVRTEAGSEFHQVESLNGLHFKVSSVPGRPPSPVDVRLSMQLTQVSGQIQRSAVKLKEYREVNTMLWSDQVGTGNWPFPKPKGPPGGGPPPNP